MESMGSPINFLIFTDSPSKVSTVGENIIATTKIRNNYGAI